MLNVLKTQYSPIGLDIGQTAVRAVQLRRTGGQWHVHTALELLREPLPPGAAPMHALSPNTHESAETNAPGKNGDTANRQSESLSPEDAKLVHLLKSLVKRSRFARKDVVLHCPTDRMDIRPVTLPTGPEGLPREAVIGALRLQLADSLSIPPEEAVFDYFTIDHQPNARQVTVMSTVADRQWVAHRIDLVRAAGLHCVGVDALPCVLARLRPTPVGLGEPDESHVAPPENTDAPSEDSTSSDAMHALLDIGYSGSTLVVTKGNVPVFSRRFSLGGWEMSNLLCQRFSLDFDKTETLKKAYGLNFRTASPPKPNHDTAQTDTPPSKRIHQAPDKWAREGARMIFDALETHLNEYLLALTRSLNYAINEYRAPELTGITLCGSAAHLHCLDQFFADQFGLPTHIADHALLGEIIQDLPHTRAQAGTWTTALGLALTEEAA